MVSVVHVHVCIEVLDLFIFNEFRLNSAAQLRFADTISALRLESRLAQSTPPGTPAAHRLLHT